MIKHIQFLCLLLLPVWVEAATSSDEIYLSVHDCIVLALDNNLEISIERLSPQVDLATIRQARGAFDPALVLTPNYEENTTPLDAASSVAAGGLKSTKSRTSSLATSLQGKIPWGTQYDFGLRTTDAQNTFNSFRDQYSTFWGLGLTQPLLKGFGAANQLTAIRIARKQKEISDESFAMKVMDIVTRIKSAYYNLVFAMENRRVQIQALDLAVRLLEDNRKRVEIGVMPLLEVTQAESGVAGREEDIILANQEVSLRTNELRSLISGNASEFWKQKLFPVDAPTEIPEPSFKLDEVISTALNDRPDYHQAKLVIEQRHLQLKYDENQTYPQVDLKSTYGFNGLGGNLPDSINSDREKWSVGFSIRIPLPDQTDRGIRDKSKLDKERAILQLKQIEQNVLVEVNNAMDSVWNSYKRIRATRVSTRAAEQALEAENMKLKTGTSTSFVILDLQKKLADTKSRQIRAIADYHIALAQLHKAEGASLRENDIELVK